MDTTNVIKARFGPCTWKAASPAYLAMRHIANCKECWDKLKTFKTRTELKTWLKEKEKGKEVY